MGVNSDYANLSSGACYSNISTANHGVIIVGWNDTYSKDNFIITPPGDGAFIIKDTHGTSIGDNGYLYISYYDDSFSAGSSMISFILDNNENYNKNYQYDLSGSIRAINVTNGTAYYKNKYISTGNDTIAGFGTYFIEDKTSIYCQYKEYDYEANIIVNGNLVYSQNGTSSYYYNTIKLNKYIPINEGDIFEVSLKITSLNGSAYIPILSTVFNNSNVNNYTDYSRLVYLPNTSFMSYDGENWVDLYDINSVACLKVYTVNDTKELSTSNLTMDYKDGSKFTSKLTYESGTIVEGETITFVVNGRTYNRTTNNEGVARLNINLAPGTYNITTKYGNLSNLNIIVVNKWNESLVNLETTNLTKYYKDNSKPFIAKVSYNGTNVSGISVKFTVNGRDYYRATNSEGIAKLNINLGVNDAYVIKSSVDVYGVSLDKSNSITVLKTNTSLSTNTINITRHNQFVTTLFGINNSLPAEKSVIISVNGRDYYRTTGSDGEAKLNINLNKGTYLVTTAFTGNNNCYNCKTETLVTVI